MIKRLYILVLCFYLPSVYAQKQTVALGTGGVTGVYYPTGGSLCRILNTSQSNHGIRCVLEETQGSISNIKRVLEGSLDLGLAQSNWIDIYYNNFLQKIDEPEQFPKIQHGTELRTLLVLYPEYFTVIVPEHSKINSFEDIKGKTISMGLNGSSLSATIYQIMAIMKWTDQDFHKILNIAPAKQAAALCNGTIDVMIYTVGHPSAAAREATQDCDTRLITVGGFEIQQMIEQSSHVSWGKIPGKLYKGNNESVTTFGVNATLFTSSELSEEVAYSLVKSIFERFEEFRGLHPAFSSLTLERMAEGPFAAPLHKGVIKYFKEVGLM